MPLYYKTMVGIVGGRGLFIDLRASLIENTALLRASGRPAARPPKPGDALPTTTIFPRVNTCKNSTHSLRAAKISPSLGQPMQNLCAQDRCVTLFTFH
jgi:hypothetical protein